MCNKWKFTPKQKLKPVWFHFESHVKVHLGSHHYTLWIGELTYIWNKKQKKIAAFNSQQYSWDLKMVKSDLELSGTLKMRFLESV